MVGEGDCPMNGDIETLMLMSEDFHYTVTSCDRANSYSEFGDG